MEIKFIGQSTFQIKIRDIVILTDPWFGLNIMRTIPIKKIQLEEIDKCDLMLVSHNHIDHFDNIAIKLAKKLGSIVIGPPSVVRRAGKKGAKTHLLNYGSEEGILGLKIKSLYAEHPLSKDAVSFFVTDTHTNENFYFSGDTRYNKKLVEELKSLPTIKVAFLQIACAVYFFKKDGLDLNDAVKLCKEVQPATAIPMHYQIKGKTADPHLFVKLIESNKIKGIVLDMGKAIEI